MAYQYAVNQIGIQNALAVSTAAVGPLTKPTVNSATGRPRHALIYVGANPIRWRADGTSPTATAGMFVAAGGYIDWTDPFTDFSQLIDNAKFIRDTSAGGDAALVVVFFN